MLTKGQFVLLEAVLHVNRYIENLEPWFSSASGATSPALRSNTNIAIIHDIIFEEVIEQFLSRDSHICAISWALVGVENLIGDALTNRLYLPHQVQSANL